MSIAAEQKLKELEVRLADVESRLADCERRQATVNELRAMVSVPLDKRTRAYRNAHPRR